METFSTTTARHILGVIVCTTEHCGGEVRWENGELQQLWQIHHVGTTGALEKITTEWRRVPGTH